ncbi:MAG TPA: hypothetical protein VJH20_02885 [Candidatus Nanoarchaeia archaeon]|nr:hypothetical protein [Candidatus Nanoarchaeia archaeon]
MDQQNRETITLRDVQALSITARLKEKSIDGLTFDQGGVKGTTLESETFSCTSRPGADDFVTAYIKKEFTEPPIYHVGIVTPLFDGSLQISQDRNNNPQVGDRIYGLYQEASETFTWLRQRYTERQEELLDQRVKAAIEKL